MKIPIQRVITVVLDGEEYMKDVITEWVEIQIMKYNISKGIDTLLAIASIILFIVAIFKNELQWATIFLILIVIYKLDSKD